MDTLLAFMMGKANRGREMMVFDWEKAARLIRKKKPSTASAGLAGDWDWTGGEVYKADKPVPSENTYVYLASTWATPELEMDGLRQDCYRMESKTPGWHEKTYWPDSAVAILKGKGLPKKKNTPPTKKRKSA